MPTELTGTINRRAAQDRRVRARITTWTRTSGLPMAVSLGVSHAPHDGSDLITLPAVADIGLYQNKAVRQKVSCSLNPNY